LDGGSEREFAELDYGNETYRRKEEKETDDGGDVGDARTPAPIWSRRRASE
jgi:hypothetical protein